MVVSTGQITGFDNVLVVDGQTVRMTRPPEDLVFIETKDRSNFQGRYVLRHPFKGKTSCDKGEQYQATLPVRFWNRHGGSASTAPNGTPPRASSESTVRRARG